MRLSELEILYYPTDLDNNEEIDNSKDPHCGEYGCYLVPSINLVRSVRNIRALNREAQGLILWLPVEKKFGIWEPSLIQLIIVKNASWSKIKKNPQAYIDLHFAITKHDMKGFEYEARSEEHTSELQSH